MPEGNYDWMALFALKGGLRDQWFLFLFLLSNCIVFRGFLSLPGFR